MNIENILRASENPGVFSMCFAGFTGEPLLKHWANGGVVVLFRAAWSALWLTAIAFLAVSLAEPNSSMEFELVELRRLISTKFEWYAAAFAGAYAAFYARFASQWQYLAKLYNQIKAVECTTAHDPGALAVWKAGFVSDCVDLHLHRKRIFLEVCVMWWRDDQVRTAYRALDQRGEHQAFEGALETFWKRRKHNNGGAPTIKRRSVT